MLFDFSGVVYLSHLISQSTLELNELNENLEKRVHEEIEKNIQKDQHIVQQSRLAQMGEMISMIAHQWRQPLTAISSTSAGINLKAKLNKLDKETAVELSDKISDYSQHLSSTIDDFREFFKPNKEKKETTYNKVIQSVLNIVETSIKNKNITIVKNLNSKEVFNTYPNEIKQVVLNLIKNAEDVLIEHEVQNPTITIKTNDDELIVKDNGGGIPEDIMPKIFDPYFSTKTKKDGTGLGLYMSKSIIQEHCGGELSVANDKDGAVFKIELKR
ncbi:MAG: HAMP domain-containing sensor histidine kinase [Campylobacterota bacterium]|nr:HAMP domain-containing sensor histidine kinase [Campylobacterota bacterium]